MAMYDPSTGKWFEYNPPPNTEPWDWASGYSPLSEVAAPTNAKTGLVDPNQSDPHTLAAQLLQSQFAEWETTFKPIEQSMINMLSFNNPDVLSDAVTKANQTAKDQTNAVSGAIERRSLAMGTPETPDQQKVIKRMLNLGQATNIANAENTARSNVRAQDEQILMGVVPNYNVVKGNLSNK